MVGKIYAASGMETEEGRGKKRRIKNVKLNKQPEGLFV